MRFTTIHPRISKILPYVVFGIVLLGMYCSALAIRRSVLDMQAAAIGQQPPFTLESALHYRRVKMLYDRGYLPKLDPDIQYPEGIRIREIDGITSEPLFARMASWFPDSIPFADRIRWLETGWFCLAVPAMAMALRIWTGSWIAALLGGLLYGLSIASVLRSTGQEISRENFSIPWLMAGFAAAAGYLRYQSYRAVWLVTFAICSGLALIAWDLMQYMIGLAALGMMVHVFNRRRLPDRDVVMLYGALVLSIGFVGLWNPYYRHHGLILSPMFAWMVSVLVAAWWKSGNGAMLLGSAEDAGNGLPWHERPWNRLALMVALPPLVFVILSMFSSYGASYGHFAELLVAKIRHLNVKPADPALLTYAQRIMWVPSLHSSTLELTNWLFPYTLWLAVVSVPAAWVISRSKPDPLVRFWLLTLVMSLAAFALFVRFHVFAIMAISLVAGWLCSTRAVGSLFTRILVVIAVCAVTVAEAMHTLRERPDMGRPNVYYRELEELAGWLKEHVSPEPVLANMGVSAFIAAYGKCPIVIHPKFEDPVIRDRLEQYGELLFGEEERALRDWMDELGVEYFVYAKGEFAREKPEYQMRYFVNRLEPSGQSPARRFENEDAELRYFSRLWGNRKYVVYRILTSAREREAAAVAAEAERMLAAGRLPEAEQQAMKAIEMDRGQEQALKVFRHAASLLEQGVRHDAGASVP